MHAVSPGHDRADRDAPPADTAFAKPPRLEAKEQRLVTSRDFQQPGTPAQLGGWQARSRPLIVGDSQGSSKMPAVALPGAAGFL